VHFSIFIKIGLDNVLQRNFQLFIQLIGSFLLKPASAVVPALLPVWSGSLLLSSRSCSFLSSPDFLSSVSPFYLSCSYLSCLSLYPGFSLSSQQSSLSLCLLVGWVKVSSYWTISKLISYKLDLVQLPIRASVWPAACLNNRPCTGGGRLAALLPPLAIISLIATTVAAVLDKYKLYYSNSLEGVRSIWLHLTVVNKSCSSATWQAIYKYEASHLLPSYWLEMSAVEDLSLLLVDALQDFLVLSLTLPLF